MLRWINNVLRGRYVHWNEANNLRFTFMWDRVSRLDPLSRGLQEKFLVASLSLVDELLGPNKGASKLLPCDLLGVEQEQSDLLHGLHCAAMSGMFGALNPQLTESLRRGVSAVTGGTSDFLEIFAEYAGKPIDLKDAETDLWPVVCDIVNVDPAGTPALSAYEYAGAFGVSAGIAFSDAREHYLKLKREAGL